jgi:peptidoglycan/xylan/chitin deacetylase (PgdA/CDA1 family)
MQARGAAILMYHGVVDRVRDPELDGWCLTAEELGRHLEALGRERKVVPLAQMVEALGAGEAPDPRWVALTFDDGYRGLFEHGRPVLAGAGVPWSVCVPAGLVGTGRTEPGLWSALCLLQSPRGEIEVEHGGQRVRHRLGSREDRLALRRRVAATPGLAEAVVEAFGEEARSLLAGYPALQLMGWEDLAALAREGASVEAHGWLHRRLGPEASPSLVEEEVVQPRHALLSRGHPCRFFCAPYGDWTPAVQERARAAGYQGLLTAEPGLLHAGSDAWALPRLRADRPWAELAGAL